MIAIPDKPAGAPDTYDEKTIVSELIKIETATSQPENNGFLYWLKNYCQVFHNDSKTWVHMDPWISPLATENGYDDQVTMALKLIEEDRVIGLKARQVGATTLILAEYLWDALFHPICFVLLLSRGDEEAKELLRRIKGMYYKLPKWMKPREVMVSSKKEWRLGNESSIVSLTTRRGDSYSATHVLIDEAALLHRANTSLKQVLLNLEPTIGQSGKIAIISKVDKTRPRATFNKMYTAAYSGKSPYKPFFIPYYVVPGRTKEWREAQIELSESMDDSVDFVAESYPETPEEALSPLSANRRLKPSWLKKCYQKEDPLPEESLPDPFDTIPDLNIWRLPEPGVRYILSADPSEGLPDSDNASIHVISVDDKEEVANLAIQAEPAVLGGYIEKLSQAYNDAPVLFELNQHGRALKLWLQEHTRCKLLKGYADTKGRRKIGWDQNARTKPLLYDLLAQVLKDGEAIIHSVDTYLELSSVESSSLSAPEGSPDDRAITFALAVAGIFTSLDYKVQVSIMVLD